MESFIVEMREGDDDEMSCCLLLVACCSLLFDLCQICVPISKPVVQEDWISRVFGDVDGSPREEKQIGQSDRLALNLKFLSQSWSCFHGEKNWSPWLMFPACSNRATQPNTTPEHHQNENCWNDGQSDRLGRNPKFSSHSSSSSWFLRGHKESRIEIYDIGGNQSFLPPEVAGEGIHIARCCLAKINFGNPETYPCLQCWCLPACYFASVPVMVGLGWYEAMLEQGQIVEGVVCQFARLFVHSRMFLI